MNCRICGRPLAGINHYRVSVTFVPLNLHAVLWEETRVLGCCVTCIPDAIEMARESIAADLRPYPS